MSISKGQGDGIITKILAASSEKIVNDTKEENVTIKLSC